MTNLDLSSIAMIWEILKSVIMICILVHNKDDSIDIPTGETGRVSRGSVYYIFSQNGNNL